MSENGKTWAAVSALAGAVSAVVAVLTFASNDRASAGANATTTPPATVAATTPMATGSAPSPAATASYRLLWRGDVRISLDGLDIDVVPPAFKPPADQVNLYVDINPPQDVFGDPETLAEWTGKAAPTATDCAAAVQQARALGQASVTARTGDRVCIVTRQGTVGSLLVTKQAVDIYTGLYGHMTLWKQG